MLRPHSSVLYEALCRLIPGGVNSPVRAFKEIGISPLIAKRGAGDTFWDEDGHAYIDYCGSWGALILGHAPERVVKASAEQLSYGSTFGITTVLEKQLAQKIKSHFPSMDLLRFVSSGTEATMSALRLARGVTGRSLIVKFDGHYHGHADALLVRAGSGVMQLNADSSSAGVPSEVVKHTVSLPFNDRNACSAFFAKRGGEIAAVIVEPVAGNMGVVPAAEGFLHMLREETERCGALLLFDEIITGFRVGLQGVQGHCGIVPDITCLGKIIGGGFPAAAFGGRKEIMEHLAPLGQVYQAGTLSGNPIAMRAGLETLEELEGKDFYLELEAKTRMLADPIQAEIEKRDLPLCLQRSGSMLTLFFGLKKVTNRDDLKHLDLGRFKEFFLHMLERGFYMPPSAYEAWFISSAHTQEHLEATRDAILQFLE